MFKNSDSMFKKLHSMFKNSDSMFKKLHSMFKNSDSMFKKLRSKFGKFIQSSETSFNVQKVHSMFKKFIQCSRGSFNVQTVDVQSSKTISLFKMFIESSMFNYGLNFSLLRRVYFLDLVETKGWLRKLIFCRKLRI